MPNTYTQIYIHIVFAVKGRKNLIPPVNRERLHKYITGIVQEREQKMLAVFCMPDHVHIFIGMSPTIKLSDLVRDVKAGSSKFITDNGLVNGKFNWQSGFGAFSYALSQVDTVVKYILNQERHHAELKFRDEYISFLNKFNVDNDEQYLFEWIE